MLALTAHVGYAQAIQLGGSEQALKEALLAFAQQENIVISFTDRQVAAHTTSCRYEGNSVAAAFSCLLANTGLRAERVRRRHYVIASVHESAESSLEAVPRGILAGFVAHASTDEVLPGAHVYLPDVRLGTTTNDAGYFVIPFLPQQPYQVRVSYLGFQPLDTLLVAGAPTANLRLQEVSIPTGDVLVEASHEQPGAVPGEVNVAAQQLDQLPSFPGEPDLFQALQWLPGVRKAGEVHGGLVVRGGEPDQNLYLLDGAPVYHPWHAFSLISTFQTETFKDVKLYQGAFPAEHGGRLSAVLDAEMRDGNGEKARAVAAIGMLSARLIVESPINDNISFMVSGRRSYLDKIVGTEHPVSEDGRNDTLRTGYYFYDTSAKITMRSGYRHRLSLSSYQGRDVLDLRLPFDLSFDFSSGLRPADLFFAIDQNWGNRLLSARYQYLYSRRFYVTATAYHSSYNAQEGVFMRPTAASFVTSEYNVRLRDLGLKVDLDYYPALTHQIRAGVQIVRRDFRSALDARVQRSPGAAEEVAQTSEVEAFEWVGYVQDSWQPTARWQVQPGLRFSSFGGGSYTRLNPRLGVRYALMPERLVLRGGGGMQVQYLHHVRDRYSYLYDLVSSRWIPASAAVRPSTSVQISGGAEGYPRPGLTLALDGYWRSSRDVLLPKDVFQTKDGLEGPGIEVGTLLGQYTRGKALAFGIEAAMRLERGPWQVWMTYTGGRSLSRAPELGEVRLRATRFDVPRAFRGTINRRGRHWVFALSTEWRSGLPTTVPVARYAIGDPLDDDPTLYLYRPQINNGRLPPYVRLDGLIGYRFRIAGAKVQTQLNLYNLTNRRNVVAQLYDPQTEGAVEVTNRRGLPLLPLLEIRLEL